MKWIDSDSESFPADQFSHPKSGRIIGRKIGLVGKFSGVEPPNHALYWTVRSGNAVEVF
jgi:hypothetical protein